MNILISNVTVFTGISVTIRYVLNEIFRKKTFSQKERNDTNRNMTPTS